MGLYTYVRAARMRPQARSAKHSRSKDSPLLTLNGRRRPISARRSTRSGEPNMCLQHVEQHPADAFRSLATSRPHARAQPLPISLQHQTATRS